MFNFILAAAEAAPKAAKAQNPFMQMIPIFLIVIVFMFLMSRSQRKQQQKREEMLNALVKGKEVMLANGIYGKISEVKEKTFIVEIAPSVCVEVAKNGVAEVVSEEPAK
ncbi:MAG: preprotein translocase subunit YajC [Lentisphaerae bacterium]|nr:preprotein translocase subunit YajC [Lentisphaerota bacterium]